MGRATRRPGRDPNASAKDSSETSPSGGDVPSRSCPMSGSNRSCPISVSGLNRNCPISVSGLNRNCPISDDPSPKQYLETTILGCVAYPEYKLREIVDRPDGLDYNEWLASHTISFFDHINMLYGCISEFCTMSGCPEMAGPGNRQYQWIDEKGKRAKFPAPQYIDYALTFTQKTVNDESIFPTKFDKEFPVTFESHVKKIIRLMFNILSHVYHGHFKEIVQLNLHSHLNCLFSHLVLFNDHFKLVQENEKELENLVDEVYLINIQHFDPLKTGITNVSTSIAQGTETVRTGTESVRTGTETVRTGSETVRTGTETIGTAGTSSSSITDTVSVVVSSSEVTVSPASDGSQIPTKSKKKSSPSSSPLRVDGSAMKPVSPCPETAMETGGSSVTPSPLPSSPSTIEAPSPSTIEAPSPSIIQQQPSQSLSTLPGQSTSTAPSPSRMEMD